MGWQINYKHITRRNNVIIHYIYLLLLPNLSRTHSAHFSFWYAFFSLSYGGSSPRLVLSHSLSSKDAERSDLKKSLSAGFLFRQSLNQFMQFFMGNRHLTTHLMRPFFYSIPLERTGLKVVAIVRLHNKGPNFS